MSDPETITTKPLFTLEEVDALFQAYENDSASYHEARFIDCVYERGNLRNGERILPAEEWQQWQEQHPRPDKEVLATLETEEAERRKQLRQTFGLENEANLDNLRTAHRAWKTQSYPESRLHGLAMNYGDQWGPFISGVLTLAKLTGQSLAVYDPAEDIPSTLYEVTPATTYDELVIE